MTPDPARHRSAVELAATLHVGFTLLGEADIEYSPGNVMSCNDWRQ